MAFARMDGERPASAATALSKAVSSATFRQESGPMPIIVGRQVIGAIGIGGGTGDVEIAKAAIQKLLDELSKR